MVRFGRAYPVQRIWTPRRKLILSPTFDVVGPGATNENTTTASWSHTAATGADIFVFCETTTSNTSFNPSGVTYNGTAMTPYAANYPTYNGEQLWHLAAAGTGSSASIVATWANAFYGVCNSISFTHVTSVSAAAYVSGAPGATATQSVTLTGAIILQGFGFSLSGTTPTVAGGTAQYNGYDSGGNSGLSINTATATTTFTASTTDAYSGIAVQLS